jgi:hypothetical protein
VQKKIGFTVHFIPLPAKTQCLSGSGSDNPDGPLHAICGHRTIEEIQPAQGITAAIKTGRQFHEHIR